MTTVPLSDLAEVNPTPDLPTLSPDDEVSFIPMGDVDESGRWAHRQTRTLREIGPGYTAFREGDVLVAKITPCLENGKGAHAVGLVNGAGYGTTEFHVLRAKPGADPRFIFYITQDEAFRVKAADQMVGSAGQQRVPARFFREYQVPSLSREEQKVAADALRLIDTSIDQTLTTISKRNSLHRGLIQTLLERGINHKGQIRDKNDADLVDTPLGRLPAEWQVEPLGRRTISSAFGPRFSADQYAERGNVALLRTTDMDNDGNVDLSALPQAHLSLAAFSSHFLEPGDVYVSRSGTLGITGVFEGHNLPVLPGAFTIRFRLNQKKLKPEFLRRYFNSALGRKRVLKTATGGVQQNLKASTLRLLLVPCPPIDEQERILGVLNQSEGSIQSIENELSKLLRLKAGLMQSLLNGRARVSDPSPA